MTDQDVISIDELDEEVQEDREDDDMTASIDDLNNAVMVDIGTRGGPSRGISLDQLGEDPDLIPTQHLERHAEFREQVKKLEKILRRK